MKVSIVIVNWNVRDFLKKCLSSIYETVKNMNFEIFVVDNNSSDNSVEMVRKEFPQVHIIVNSENLGFARANNLAIKKCKGEYILILNPDCQLQQGALSFLVNYLEGHKNVDVVAPKLVYSDGSLQRSCRHFPSLLSDFFESIFLSELFPHNSFLNRYYMGLWNHSYTKEVDQLFGACFLIKKTCLDKVGIFDEQFFMYYDEIDLFYRIKKAKGRIVFYPDAVVVHHANKSSNQIFMLSRYWMYHSRILFFNKHFGKLSVYFMGLNLILRSIIVYGFLPLLHLMINKPADLNYFKNPLKIIWKEYLNYIKIL